jgi:hypothetical protein
MNIMERNRHVARRSRTKPDDWQRRFACLDCTLNTLSGGECFTLHDAVWLKANPRRKGALCIACVEARLGRRLTPGDFQGTPLDHHLINGPALSQRLMSRIGGPANQLMRIHRELGLIYFDHPKMEVHAQ